MSLWATAALMVPLFSSTHLRDGERLLLEAPGCRFWLARR
jgi:hypothetical protein